MKFSWALLKKLVPEAKNKKGIIEKLNLHFTEAEEVKSGVLDISIPSNRFSDAASHWGLAREISVILGKSFDEPKADTLRVGAAPLEVKVQSKELCSSYAAQYVENVKVKDSPRWLQKILMDCGLRPINNVVDVMNYVMLETGQPLHAFDYDKIAYLRGTNVDLRGKGQRESASSPSQSASIVIRRAKRGEKITTLDNKIYELDENILVIADEKEPIAVAGIKGGKKAEVDLKTNRIVIEAANFKGVSIYKASRFLKLDTDASLRFSHNLSPLLIDRGIRRASQLIKEIIGASPAGLSEVNFIKPSKTIIKFDIKKFNRLVGTELDFITISKYLINLGFKIILNEQSKFQEEKLFLVEPPPLREDIKFFEDIAEEVIRFYGYDKIKKQAPHIQLHPSGLGNLIVFKERLRRILTGFGLDEVCNYSFISRQEGGLNFTAEKLVELENPISEDLFCLRPSLAPGLIGNVKTNLKFFDEVGIFEIGRTFQKNSGQYKEKWLLSLASASKKDDTFFGLKGLLIELFRKAGLVRYSLVAFKKHSRPLSVILPECFNKETVLRIESEGKNLGYLGQLRSSEKTKINLLEINLEFLMNLVVEEYEYQPLSKYPSAMRDISVLVDSEARIGEVIQTIQEVDLNLIEDVDLIDEYDVKKEDLEKLTGQSRSLTFRIIFQASDRTLTDKEVNQKTGQIVQVLVKKYSATVR